MTQMYYCKKNDYVMMAIKLNLFPWLIKLLLNFRNLLSLIVSCRALPPLEDSHHPILITTYIRKRKSLYNELQSGTCVHYQHEHLKLARLAVHAVLCL